MNLQSLMSGLEITNRKEIPPISIADVVYDSRKAGPDSLFVAMKGLASDGHLFVDEAVKRGAKAVVCEREVKVPSEIPCLVVPNAREALARISNAFFENPTREMAVVGVTGTNGKTTITYLIEALLQNAGRSPSVLGTINYRHGKTVFPASHTTPESYDLQRLIRTMKGEGSDSVVMEVSSHALDLHRVDGIQFDAAVFTNLSPEHQDYHPDMESYFSAKTRLFRELLVMSSKKEKTAVLNRDDVYAKRLLPLPASLRALTFSLSDPEAEIFASSHTLSLEGIEAEVKTPWGVLSIKSPLLGDFNLSNLLAAVGVGGALGVSLGTMEETLRNFRSVPGRLERVPNSRGLHVFVDYAHTPDALKNVLSSLRSLLSPRGERKEKAGSMITVFGCGGDRDRSKRPLMGQEVAHLSDFAVVTSDNPRTEDPQAILKEILPGLLSREWKEGNQFEVEVDRKKAIRRALETANPGDIVLIAGKGHEDYQILGKTKVHFDDREVVREFLK
ncbi:MAG: UDP-N-acetylmuramoyl-L-alanyl-D-glutamate--2,6-diaminopimelate ligase [bacterium]